MKDLISACKRMAENCQLENSEQITSETGAIGAVLMIESEYLNLRKRYLEQLEIMRKYN